MRIGRKDLLSLRGQAQDMLDLINYGQAGCQPQNHLLGLIYELRQFIDVVNHVAAHILSMREEVYREIVDGFSSSYQGFGLYGSQMTGVLKEKMRLFVGRCQQVFNIPCAITF